MGNMSRRKFLRAGAQGVAVAAIPLIFRVDPLAAFAQPETTQLADYYKHFGVDEEVLRKVMAAALSRGGDYCDLYFEHSIANTIGLEDNAVNRAYSNVDMGVGIRVLKGEQTGYSFTEDLNPEAMRLAALTAANIAAGAGAPGPAELGFHKTPDYYPIETRWEEIGIQTKIPYLQKLNERMAALDNRLIKVRVYSYDSSSHILIARSDGRVVCDYRPMTELSGNCTAEQNGKRENGYYTIAGRHGIEFFTEANLERIAQRAVSRTVALFDAVKPEGGEMPVVLGAGSSGVLLHEAIGHGMEGDFNRKGESIYSDKIGKKVAEPFITIIDDGTNPGARGSLNFDDEGNDTEQTVLVENGIYRSYMHDRISANFYGVKPTGNGRRESFRHPPMPRMRNTYMLNGPHAREEIIRSVKKGVYCEDFTNGEVNIGPGDFSFYVKCGNLIEDGRITAPVKDINLIGNGPKVLEQVTMAANDLVIDEAGWDCGKNGQSVPVSHGLPTVLVSAITVGGVSR